MRARQYDNTELIVGGIVLLYLFRDQLSGIGAKIGTAIEETVVGITQGIGSGINSGIINPIAQQITGDPNATAGGAIWDAFNSVPATPDVIAVIPSAYRMSLYGDVYNSGGAMLGYVTDEGYLRDAGGRVLGNAPQVLAKSVGWGATFTLPSFASIVGG